VNAYELTGRARTHVVQDDALRFAMAPAALEAFLDMRAEAAKSGFDLRPYSSFRDFPAQLRIWNRKARGEATLYDPRGTPLDYASLTPPQVVDAILAWSALPGASRHHWGTDVDVYDGARVPDRSKVELLPAETEPGGVFHELFLWLSEALPRFGFFRPYDRDRGGFNPEPWHLSFAPLSVPALAALSPEVLAACLREEPDVALAEHVWPRLPEIHARYVLNVAPVHHMTQNLAEKG
jgi:LAS superfamily LD-carboxypeptidase LdcB